jgi:hypothetical protein
MIVNVLDKSYDMGSKLYPINSKNEIRYFKHDNTFDIVNEGLSRFIDSNTFNPGFCYTNAGILCSAGSAINIKIEFFAGWVFIGENPPVHHSWAVLDGNVIDVGFRKSVAEVLHTVDYCNPQWREGAAMRIKAREKRIPLSKDCIMGKVFDYLLFVGTKDTPELAKRRYNIMIDRFPNHPSYVGRNDTHSMTALQKELYKLKI